MAGQPEMGNPTELVRRQADLIFVAAGAFMLAILLYVGRWFLFWRDEWDFIFGRPDPTPQALLTQYGGHFVAIPVLAYDALLAVFGLRTYLPYLAVAWVAHFLVAGLLYRIVSRRSGSILGLAAGLSMLFLGSGFEVFLHPFQIQYGFALVGGLVAIDQLDEPGGGRPRIMVAAVALVLAVASSGLGVICVGLVLLWGLLRRSQATLVAVAPAIVIYSAWYLAFGRGSGFLAGPGLTPVESVYAVLYGMGAAAVGLLGLPPSRFALVGVGLGLATVAVLAVLVRRGYRPDALAIAALAALLAENVLQTIFRAAFGVEHGARPGYVYAGVVFVWVALAGLAGRRIEAFRWRGRALPLAATFLILPMVLANMRQLAGIVTQERHLRATELAELRLIESLRDDPRLALDIAPDGKYLIAVTPRGYLTAIDRFGRPALGWDGWEVDVDAAAVEAARRRLLSE
jgi:hypothetical protein